MNAVLANRDPGNFMAASAQRAIMLKRSNRGCAARVLAMAPPIGILTIFYDVVVAAAASSSSSVVVANINNTNIMIKTMLIK